MAKGIEASIIEGLQARLKSLVLSPVMPIAWPNVNYDPANEGYLRAQWFPNETDQITLGTTGQNRHVGLYQVDVFWPLDKGEVEPLERAALIVEHFKRGTIIIQDDLIIRIVTPPTVAPSLTGDAFLQIPIRIRYQVDADNP